MTRQLICIRCPLGCPLTVELEGNEVRSVTGQGCKRGEDYAKIECTAPTRTITSSVPVEGGVYRMLPLRTAGDIPKDRISACMEALTTVTVHAPVRIGDVIVANVAGTGVDMVATRNIDAADATNQKHTA